MKDAVNSKVKIHQAAEGRNQETVRLAGAFCGERGKIADDFCGAGAEALNRSLFGASGT